MKTNSKKLITNSMFRFRNWKIYNEARELRMEVHKKLFPKIPEKEKFCLIAVPLHEWKKRFSKLFQGIHQKTMKDSSEEIERDITFASRQKIR